MFYAGFAILGLVAYCVIRGYHHDTGLMLTVMFVRLAAAIGVGGLVGALLAGGMLVLRRPGAGAALVRTSTAAASLTTLLLVAYNLL
jgi:hypothetical protein